VLNGRRRPVRVVKVGGNELDRPEWLSRCGEALREAGPVVVVHGGGRAVDALSRKLDLPVEKRDGIRVTTPDIAAVVEMVLSGPANRQMVTALRSAGIDALGLSGVDGGLLFAERVSGGLGQVGRIINVRTGLLESLLLAGFTPVVAPVAPSEDSDTTPLNVNADDAAAAVAGALGADELLFVSDVAGVTVHGTTQPALSTTEIEDLVARGVAVDGMAAKLRAAAAALAAGVRAVRIGDLRLLTDATAGTRLLTGAPQPA
jgi:acetylglutamate kinase